MGNNNVYLEEYNDIGYTVSGIKHKTNTTSLYNNKDMYDTVELAEMRAYNIGCSGHRIVISNGSGEYKYAPCSELSDYKNVINFMKTKSVNRTYYDFDSRQNIFDIRDGINDNLFEGFDYKGNILRRTLSNVIYKDPIKEGILEYFEKVLFGLVESTKRIKNFFNYTVKNNNRRVF